MPRLHGFTKKRLLHIYELMVQSRRLDEKTLTLLKQGKSYFHIGGSGHEATQLAAAEVFEIKKDWAYPYYRDSAFCLGLGMTGREQLLCSLSRVEDPNSSGRQMPGHFSHKDFRIVTQSSATGTQYLQAVGSAMAVVRSGENGIVYVSSGEGATSEGDFHEALNWSSRERLPVIFHIQDNKYAISVHISEQTAGSVYDLAAGYNHLARFQVDGTDLFESHLAFQKAVDRARKGKGPSVIVSDVVRLLSHSSSDDQRKYRSEEELETDRERDPILKLREACISNEIIKEEDFEEIDERMAREVDEDAVWAESRPHPSPETATDYVYSNVPFPVSGEKKIIAKKIVMVDAINHALHEEMTRNEKMVIYGEDVAGEKGGVFTTTRRLTEEFGEDRVFNSPLAESSIVGTAIGMACVGWKPVVEIQFGDYIWYAMMQIRNELAAIRYRSANSWSCPVIIRVPVGGYIHGGPYHSQSIDGYFCHLPGIRIAYPSNAEDAKGLLKMACRMDDPVMFMEHKGLYRYAPATTTEPGDDYLLPFGRARIVKEGNDLSIVTYGMMVYKSLEAAKTLSASTGVEVEIVDLRTLNPIDMETVRVSIQKTNRVIVVYEDNLTNGPGAEIAALIADQFFESLDGPVRRVASKDSHVGFSPYLENAILPQSEQIVRVAQELLEY
ncbi:MAG: dehydrogenase E1 component subunit alpha/beta [Candidatus Neomarinimicrobiota bacterium]|nr:dehydrogenase E1 component subunit alpha/beta [Candidatus Neomarinimicrobiota bacterium]